MEKTSQESLQQNLVELFQALLDEALVVAITADFDLADKSDFETAKAILEDLAKDVPSEEATGFNPSGISAIVDDSSHDTKDTSTTHSTNITYPKSVNQVQDSSSVDHSPPNDGDGDQFFSVPQLTSFNDETEEGKLKQLHGMFPELKQYDVIYALRKATGDFQSALDDLLNIQYLQATGQQTKGIDGFFEEESPIKSNIKKKKKKGKSVTPMASKDSNSSLDSRSLGIYLNEVKDQSEISYLAERFNLAFDEVSQIFYDKDGSISATAVEILDQRLSQPSSIPISNESSAATIESLARKYRHVPEKYLQCIDHATSNIMQFSDDLAALVNKHFAKKAKGQKLDINSRLTPLPHEDIEGDSISSNKSATLKGSHSMPLIPTTRKTLLSDIDLPSAMQMSKAHLSAQRDAASSASVMYRKGASNPLYRQAAGFYAERAREHAQNAHYATSVSADLLVDQQSSVREIDLHGVSVQDGTRIARQKAFNWWQGLGEVKSRKAKERPLIIITGIGRHSIGGVSQLRRSVAAALLQDGWKVEAGTGKFTIDGRR